MVWHTTWRRNPRRQRGGRWRQRIRQSHLSRDCSRHAPSLGCYYMTLRVLRAGYGVLVSNLALPFLHFAFISSLVSSVREAGMGHRLRGWPRPGVCQTRPISRTTWHWYRQFWLCRSGALLSCGLIGLSRPQASQWRQATATCIQPSAAADSTLRQASAREYRLRSA